MKLAVVVEYGRISLATKMFLLIGLQVLKAQTFRPIVSVLRLAILEVIGMLLTLN